MTDSVDRQRIIAAHLPLVYSIVRQYANKYTAQLGIDRADLIQEGSVALVVAYGRFDHERGSSFKSFAAHRIRGAILDYLRSQHIVSRSIQMGKRNAHEIDERYLRELHRHPTRAEFCAELNYTAEQWDAMRIGINAILPMETFDALISHDADGGATIGDVVLVEPLSVEEQVDELDLADEVRRALAKLPPETEIAIRGQYFEQILGRDTARQLGVKPDRVTRLKRKGLVTLRLLLRHLTTGDEPKFSVSPKTRAELEALDLAEPEASAESAPA